jgi:hypothetical protein
MEYPSYNKTKEEQLDWSHLAYELLSETRFGRKEVTKEGTRSGGRRREQILDDLMERQRCWNLKKEALDCTLCRTRFGSSSGALVKHST